MYAVLGVPLFSRGKEDAQTFRRAGGVVLCMVLALHSALALCNIIADENGIRVLLPKLFFKNRQGLLIPFKRTVILAFVFIGVPNVVIRHSRVRMLFSQDVLCYNQRFLMPFKRTVMFAFVLVGVC